MLKSDRLIRRSVARFLSAMGLFIALLRPAIAQRAMPNPALLPGANPLCDGILVPCLVIDDFAAHAYLHPQVLPTTDLRDTAAVFPFGIALGVAGRIAGGVSTHFAFWKEGDVPYQQLGPLRLNLTVRLLPLFPLWSGSGDSENPETGQMDYAPPRRFQLGLSYEHEIRVWKFDGANSLGLLTDLATLRLVASRMLGPLQLSGSVGALCDPRGQFASGELAAQVGLYLPFFKELKVYIEALGRGVPAVVKKDALVPVPDSLAGQDPIHSQGAVGVGLSFHPHARVDLGVSVHRGFRGLAPWTVSINFLTLSVGKTYQDRAATPVAQTAADVAGEFGNWVAEQWKTIDPYLKRDCILYDDNHQPTGKLGELGPDGTACIYQGLRVPIGPHFWHNKANTLLCNDQALKDCFLVRNNKDTAWEPIHPMLINGDCFAYFKEQPWMRVGTPTADKQGCERDGHVIPVGQLLKPERASAGYYCYEEPDKAKKQTQKLWCLQPPQHPQTDAQYLMRRWAGGIDRAQEDLAKQGARLQQGLNEGAQGVPLHATTPVKEAVGAFRGTIDRIKNVTPAEAERAFHGVLTATQDWLNEPLRQQLGDVAEGTGDAMASPSTYIPGGMVGREGRLVAEGGEVVADAAKAGKTAKQAVRAVEHAEHTVVDAAQAEKRATQAAERAKHEAKNRKPSSPGKMQQEVNREQAPRDVHRVDRPHVESGEPHVHFCDGTSCNQSGTVHDAHKGMPNPSNATRDWLKKHGWVPPKIP